MAPRISLKDLYGERGAARFTKQRHPANVRAQAAYPNGSTYPGVPDAGVPPSVQPWIRVPGQPVPGGTEDMAGAYGFRRVPGVAGFGAANFGAAFCRGIEPFLQNLATLLSAASAVGLKLDPVIVGAQAVYDDINGFVAYIPFIGTDCERNTAEVQAAIARVQARMADAGAPPVALPRPDAVAADPYGVPTWMKAALLLGGAALVLGYVAPAFKLFGGRKSLSLFPQLVGYPKRGAKRRKKR